MLARYLTSDNHDLPSNTIITYLGRQQTAHTINRSSAIVTLEAPDPAFPSRRIFQGFPFITPKKKKPLHA
ncbi:hypothetical protein AWENTII_000552 [Aspergillus wentii]